MLLSKKKVHNLNVFNNNNNNNTSLKFTDNISFICEVIYEMFHI